MQISLIRKKLIKWISKQASIRMTAIGSVINAVSACEDVRSSLRSKTKRTNKTETVVIGVGRLMWLLAFCVLLLSPRVSTAANVLSIHEQQTSKQTSTSSAPLSSTSMLNSHSKTTSAPTLSPQARQHRAVTNEAEAQTRRLDTEAQPAAMSEKRAFVIELLKMLHEQYADQNAATSRPNNSKMEDRQSSMVTVSMASSLMEAIGADGDMKRLIDWVRNSFNLASIGEVTTQFVVSKLGAVNCPAILKPDSEESLVPRFLLFNEHYVDVPFELSINPTPKECLTSAKFDPARKTLVLVHGYLAGYTLVDGITNIKNRIIDLNRFANERAMEAFLVASNQASLSDDFNSQGDAGTNSTSYVFTEDLNSKIRSQLYNVIIVDWFNGANPSPRSNYIRAAVNAQVVGKLIARFLSALVVQCGSPAANLQIVSHSLGCHVTGFTGKAMNSAGHRIGRITHLDPVGLCFGRLFSKPQFRLSPDDALETQAVHTALNIFDNPLDGVHSNFLVNGGRDQPGCGGGQSELKNSTTSSVSILFDPAAKFAPCSHIRAMSLFEDDHSSDQGHCQYVGYRCANYNRFLAGKCGHCDAINSQCRLMGLSPLRLQFRKSSLSNVPIPPSLMYNSAADHEITSTPYARGQSHHLANLPHGSFDLYQSGSLPIGSTLASLASSKTSGKLANEISNTTTDASAQSPRAPSGALDLMHQEETGKQTTKTTLASGLPSEMYGAPAYIVGQPSGATSNELARRRAQRRLSAVDQGARFALALGRLRADTRSVLAEGLSSLRGGLREHMASSTSLVGNKHHSDEDSNQNGPEYSVGAGDSPAQQAVEPGFESTEITTTQPSTTMTPTEIQENTPRTSPAVLSPLNVPESSGGDRSATAASDEAAQRVHAEPVDQIPIGGQQIPAGSLNMPLFYLGSGAISPYCVNYYQLRILIAETRLLRVLRAQGLASNRLAPQLSQHTGGLVSAAASLQHRAQTASGRDMLHMTVKLTDSAGHFFKGFSILEHSRMLARVPNELTAQHPAVPLPFATVSAGEPLIEITMLLNSTQQRPIRVGESILSYYFHPIVLADRIEVNYMSNISPDVRAKYSSILCPVAINDRYQLVRYIECHKIARASAGAAAKARK